MFSFSLRGIISVTMVMVCFLIPGSSLAQQWEYLGLEHESITSIVTDPTDENTIYAGAFNIFMDPDGIGGIFMSTNAGANWDPLLTDGICVNRLIMHPNDPKILYASLGAANASMPGVIKTTNGGEDWYWAGDGIYVDWETDAYPLVIDPLHPDTLYVGTGGIWDGSVYKTTNGGVNWVDIGEGVDDSDKTAIAIDPINTQILYVGCIGGGRLYKTVNGGDDWFQLPLDVLHGFYSLAVDPQNPLNVYAGSAAYDDGYIYKSTDGGGSWSDPIFGTGDETPLEVIFYPDNSDYIFTATMGVFLSTDNGITWEIIGEGLEDSWVSTLSITSSGDYLYCAARSEETGGIYRLDIRNLLSIEDPDHINDVSWRLSNYPNPFSSQTTINYAIGSPGVVSLQIYNVSGQLVKSLVNGHLSSGQHQVKWDGLNDREQPVPNGTYLYRLKTGEYTETNRMTIVR